MIFSSIVYHLPIVLLCCCHPAFD